jgi:probable F420-dependent oxidoreductase
VAETLREHVVEKQKAQLSTNLPTFASESQPDWNPLVSFALAADQAGFDRLVLSDHVVFGEHMDAYADPSIGGSRDGRQPTGPDGAWLEPLVTIAHLSAIARRVRFGTNILIAALRRPVVLAKMASTIDVLSGGRLDLGVGVGWQREEYDSAGISFETRGRILNQTLEVCHLIWENQVVSYESPELSFESIHQMPKPAQPGGIPIWVSGTVNPRSMDRLARFGQGWIPWGPDAASPEDGIGRMRAAMEQRGRDPGGIQIVGSLRSAPGPDGLLDLERSFANVPQLQDAGVTDFRLAVSLPPNGNEAVDYFAQIVAAFRARTK